jgi:hypothetical protein
MDHQEKLEFLANSIKGARKVMEKVEDGKVSTNQNTRRGMSEADVDKMLDSDTNYLAEAPINRTTQQPNPGNYMKNLSKSKMPAAILQSFAENPIIDPTMPMGMESMMQEITKKAAPVQEVAQKVFTESTQTKQSPVQLDTQLIEYIIKKTVEETLEQVSKRTTIDETIQIKIGDKVFGGKLTVLKENNVKK